MNQQEKSKITSCIRCGTCCMKGGPALHDEDINQIENGLIPLSSLYTIRKGERVRDNVNGGMDVIGEEIIKIKSIPESDACVFYEDNDKTCRIYENRPLECRKQECWDTDAIINVYSKTRLTRKKILSSLQWILEVVETHESRCSFEEIKKLVDSREKGDGKGSTGLQNMINDDAHFRYLLINKGNISSDMLDFLLGRPLADSIPHQFGVKVIHKGQD